MYNKGLHTFFYQEYVLPNILPPLSSNAFCMIRIKVGILAMTDYHVNNLRYEAKHAAKRFPSWKLPEVTMYMLKLQY